MQVEQTTRRIPGLTGTGMSVCGLPTRYCSAAAPQSDGFGGGRGDTGGAGRGAAGGAAVACSGGGGTGGDGLLPAHSAISAATAQILTLPCAVLSLPPVRHRGAGLLASRPAPPRRRRRRLVAPVEQQHAPFIDRNVDR